MPYHEEPKTMVKASENGKVVTWKCPECECTITTRPAGSRA